jgi:hypothetical protein
MTSKDLRRGTQSDLAGCAATTLRRECYLITSRFPVGIGV